MPIRVKRAYEPPEEADGRRILVDRVWPRGRSKAALSLDGWCKEVAPSAGLRRWFGHDPEKWSAFKERYFRELDGAGPAVAELRDAARAGTLTLVYGAAETRFNNAVALKDYLERDGSEA